MKYIQLSRHEEKAIVDDEDYEKIMALKLAPHSKPDRWQLTYSISSSGGKKNYATKTFEYKKWYLHRFVYHINGMEIPSKMEIDHINGNGLDNRKSNLRLASSRQNKANCGLRSDNSSGYKGVNFMASRSKWRAQLWVNGKNTHLGLYETLEDAILAYNRAAIKEWGEYALLNQLPS
jgi:hypothetical protein